MDTYLGTANVKPTTVEAGSFVTITYTYICGSPMGAEPSAAGLKIVFRLLGNFGTPQFEDSVKPNYCSVHSTSDCVLELRWDNRGNQMPWAKSLFIRIKKGFLNKGDKIVIVFGDRSDGSPGWQMQTFCENTFEFRTLVDLTGLIKFKTIQNSPTLRIIPGKPVRAVCIVPSQITINKNFVYYLKLEDKWGNPTCVPIKMRHSGFTSAGIKTVDAKDKNTGLSAQSNPIDVLAKAVKLHKYWADLHGQTEESFGTNSIEDYFSFARDYGLLDVCAHQANDTEVTDEFWRTINKTAKKFNKKNIFVTFPGYEWSGITPLGGDRNVYFSSEGGRITRSTSDLLPEGNSVYDNSLTATDLFKNLKGQRIMSFVFAHVGGRYANLEMHDPDIEIAIEVHSAWGTFEWLLNDALQRGYRIGICANSDGHYCCPGASYPGAGVAFGSMGGLTCILSRRLDRRSILRAIMARHFYATTGNRSLIDVQLKIDGYQSAIMGDIVQIGKNTPILNVNVAGTATVESIEVQNGLNVVQKIRPYNENDLGNRIKIVWGGAEVLGSGRMVRWNGRLYINNNRIINAKVINYWNANERLTEIGQNQLEWESSTTGGVSGIILELEVPSTGSIRIDTLQGAIEVDIASIGIEPAICNFGGIQKRIEIYRIPGQPYQNEFSFNLPLTDLREGDNPIYIRMVQEDGHMAWTSPIYIVNSRY